MRASSSSWFRPIVDRSEALRHGKWPLGLLAISRPYWYIWASSGCNEPGSREQHLLAVSGRGETAETPGGKLHDTSRQELGTLGPASASIRKPTRTRKAFCRGMSCRPTNQNAKRPKRSSANRTTGRAQ
jgi:hypothetical protein